MHSTHTKICVQILNTAVIVAVVDSSMPVGEDDPPALSQARAVPWQPCPPLLPAPRQPRLERVLPDWPATGSKQVRTAHATVTAQQQAHQLSNITQIKLAMKEIAYPLRNKA